MVEIIQLGRGISNRVNKIMDYIKENPNEFLVVGRVHDGNDNYSFIALFKDKCTIGKKSAVMEEWGTNDGRSGVGGSWYRSMNKFLKENNIRVIDITLSPEDAKKIGYAISDESSFIKEWEDRKKIWEKYIKDMIHQIGA